MSTKLSLRIHRVKCVDETNGKWVERIGNDEIYLGGFAVDDKAQTTEIAATSIYPHFDDGDVKTFNPPRVFHTFSLSDTGEWPRTFGIGLILIEKDAGRRMAEAVKRITVFAKEKILEKLAEEKKKQAETPSFVGVTSSALLMTTIKIIAPYVLDYVITKINRALGDDIFRPQIVTLEIPSAGHNWSGSKDSVEKTVRFKDYGGVYEVTYDWQIS